MNITSRIATLQRIALAALVLGMSGCATGPSGPRIDNVPMYGQPATPRPEELRQADDDFIKKAAAGFGGSRENASKAWSDEGNKFLSDLNADYAMRRYNQSWLLNPSNYQPYWGFARVMVQTNRFNEAIEHFETAKKLCDDNFQKVALLSDTGVAYSFARKFEVANANFQASTTLDPKYATAWLRWSQSLYREGNDVEAWSKLKQVRSLGGNIPEAFLRDLGQRMPEPR